MKRFRVPPGWPAPPRRNWTPPKDWQPHPSWPPAPKRWRFWVDAKGKPVIGPVGSYGGVRKRSIAGGTGGVAAFVAINLWALSAIDVIGGDPGADQARRSDESTVPSVVIETTPAPRSTVTRTPPAVVPTKTPSAKPTPRKVSREASTPSRRRTSSPPPPTRKPAAPRRTVSTQPSQPPAFVVEGCKQIPEWRWWCEAAGWSGRDQARRTAPPSTR